MKLILTLLVRDEADIIRTNIRYHLSQGVDFIIAMDNMSKDGTTDILREYERKGILKLIIQEEDDYSQGKWVTGMARLAFNGYSADWVINGDADEFWWPAKGNLRTFLSAIPAENGIIEVLRYDHIARPESEGSLFDRMIIRDNYPVNHIGRPLPPKVIHRGLPDVVVAQGNHGLEAPEGLMTIRSDEIEIFHFPMRTYSQFENKIALGGAAYERNSVLPKTMALGWRRLYEEYLNGRLTDYYHSREPTPSEIKEAIDSGRYSIDTRLRNYLHEHCPHDS